MLFDLEQQFLPTSIHLQPAENVLDSDPAGGWRPQVLAERTRNGYRLPTDLLPVIREVARRSPHDSCVNRTGVGRSPGAI